MSDKIGVEVEGMKELEIKLQDPELVGRPMQEVLEEAAEIGQNSAVEGISGGTGIAERSIESRVTPTTAKVFSMIADDRVQSIEEGRPSGADPDAILPQIIRWKEAVGHPDSGREISLEIQRRGTKGKRFLTRAREVVEGEIPRLLSNMVQRVREAFHR